MHRKIRSMCQWISRKVQCIDKGRLLYTAFLLPTALVAVPVRAYAADTIWTKASEIMKDIYTQVLSISSGRGCSNREHRTSSYELFQIRPHRG